MTTLLLSTVLLATITKEEARAYFWLAVIAGLIAGLKDALTGEKK